MKKYLFYAMRGEKMCFLHVLMNALDLSKAGHPVKIIFEGESVKLPQVLSEEANPLYQGALEAGLIEGACKACSVMLGVEGEIKRLGLAFLSDMNGHAGIKQLATEGYEVVVF